MEENRKIIVSNHLRLQRFADVVIETDDNDPPGTPEPMPEPTPGRSTMPSGIAPEAWKNVEEMLVTLSNNTRIQLGALGERIEKLETIVSQSLSNSETVLSEVRQTMAEFKQLLQDATVEVPEEEVKQNEERKEDQKSGHVGYLSRRK